MSEVPNILIRADEIDPQAVRETEKTACVISSSAATGLSSLSCPTCDRLDASPAGMLLRSQRAARVGEIAG